MYLIKMKSPISLTFLLVFIICYVRSEQNANNLSTVSHGGSRKFAIDYENNRFEKDGKPFRYVSGSIHYFRSTEEQWEDLLRRCRLGGLNAITTYVAWNLHQSTSEAKFNYEGNLNIFKFIEIAQKNDLLVILRPSPYIDAEWDMGGLPAWLLWEKPGMKLRTKDLEYTYFVSRWLDELLPKLRPYLYENGGPIIMMQVENEYGSYGCEHEYTTFLRDLIRFHLGENLVLFSTDGDAEWMVKCGSIPGVYATVDFGPKSPEQINSSFAVQRKFAPNGPLINSEFYSGWIDNWGKPHSTTSSAALSSSLDTILALGANVNIYMYHGGTSFGFNSGANIFNGIFYPEPTSYDYDAPLNEAGDPTDKYFDIKSTIAKYMNVSNENPTVTRKGAYGKVHLRKLTGVLSPEFVMLFGGLRTHSKLPLSFEQLQVGSGFVLYQAKIDFITSDPILLSAPELKDRAYIYVDKVFAGILSRQQNIYSMPIRARYEQTISMLVENQGRVCYGLEINENKGPGANVTLGGKTLSNWEIFPIQEIDGKKLAKYSNGLKSGAIFNEEDELVEIRNGGSGSFWVGNFSFRSTNDSTSILDTFIRLDGFSKGIIWINGFNLGRYWPIMGPQVTLYLPKSLLKPHPETNTFLVFELESAPDSCLSGSSSFPMQDNGDCFITLNDTPEINGPTPYKADKHFYRKKHY